MIRLFLTQREVFDMLEKHVVVEYDEQAKIDNVVLVLNQEKQMDLLQLELSNVDKRKKSIEEKVMNTSFTKEEWLLLKLALEIGVGKLSKAELSIKERSELSQLYHKFINLQVNEEIKNEIP